MKKEEVKKEETKPCPLCGTMLLYDKWLKVVGVYEEQQKHKKQLESELNKAKEQEVKSKQKEKEMRVQYNTEKLKLKQQSVIQRKKLQEKFKKEKQRALNQVKKEGIKIGFQKERQKFQQEQERIKKKLERQKRIEVKQAIQKGTLKGIEKQKARTKKASQMAEKYRKDRDKAMEKVRQLEEMVKKGLETENDELLGKAYGFPQTAIDAYIGKKEMIKNINKLPEDEFPKNVSKMAFVRFKLSKDNWREELKLCKKWADVVKKASPKLYKEFYEKK